jgi:hypothetical protein
MRVGDVYASEFVRAQDVPTLSLVTVESYAVERVGQGDKAEEKLILALRGAKKRFVVNKTNADALAKIFGTDELDDWIGKRFVLYPDVCQFAGKSVPCLRVKAAPQPQKKKPEPEPDPDPELEHSALDGEPTPF